jgi:hypothetical protein
MLDLNPPGIVVDNDKEMLSLVLRKICSKFCPGPLREFRWSERLMSLRWFLFLAGLTVLDKTCQLASKTRPKYGQLGKRKALG